MRLTVLIKVSRHMRVLWYLRAAWQVLIHDQREQAGQAARAHARLRVQRVARSGRRARCRRAGLRPLPLRRARACILVAGPLLAAAGRLCGTVILFLHTIT